MKKERYNLFYLRQNYYVMWPLWVVTPFHKPSPFQVWYACPHGSWNITLCMKPFWSLEKRIFERTFHLAVQKYSSVQISHAKVTIESVWRKIHQNSIFKQWPEVFSVRKWNVKIFQARNQSKVKLSAKNVLDLMKIAN